MKVFLSFCTIIVWTHALSSISSTPFHRRGKNRIMGGYVAHIENHSYLVDLRILEYTSYIHNCAGVIYFENIIITAAHCTFGLSPTQLKIVAGTNYSSGNDGFFANVKRILIHENFFYYTQDNDIALLLLDVALPLNNITMRRIPLAATEPVPGAIATASGWGRTSDHSPLSPVLRAVRAKIVDRNECRKQYENTPISIGDSKICADFPGVYGESTCNGDSGGPLVLDDFLVGIVSGGGPKCGLPDYQSFYTNIAYYNSWIVKSANKLARCFSA